MTTDPVQDHTHVDAAEAADANDPAVGDGTPATAPDVPADDWAELAGRHWRPTRKWVVARVTALLAILTMWQVTGGWDAEETIAVIALVGEGAISYLTPNDATPGGVPQ